MSTNSSGEESDLLPLVSSTRIRGETSRIVYNRILLVFLLLVLIGVSFTFNLTMKKMSAQLVDEQTHIEHLDEIIQKQSAVIQRFNQSVTNTDVLEKVDSLQNQLETTEADMLKRLESSEQQVHILLNKTVKELDDSIAAAKDEIHDEVEQVKTAINGYVRTTQDQFSMENSFMVYQLAGTFTVLGCLIAMWHMTDHLRNFHEPFVQRKVLAILWMSPIYSITSWLSLVFVSSEGYLAIIKDFYEAYCIYTFLSFIIAVLGRGDREAVVTLLARHAEHLSPPIRLCGWCYPNPYENNRAMAHAVLLQCQIFAMQFVFLRPFISILQFTFIKTNFMTGPGVTFWQSPQTYLSIVNNISVFVAFSGLLKIYHAVHHDLSWWRPLPKFLCIKGIVFMTFWQGLAISILARSTDLGNTIQNGNNENSESENIDEWAARAQNFLICLEMLLFSVAHFYVFPTDEWKPGYRPIQDTETKFGDNLALRDFFSDIKLILGTGKKGKSDKNYKKKKSRKKDHGSLTKAHSNNNVDVNMKTVAKCDEPLMKIDEYKSTETDRLKSISGETIFDKNITVDDNEPMIDQNYDGENNNDETKKKSSEENKDYNDDVILVSQEIDENVVRKNIELNEDFSENESREKDFDAENDDDIFDDETTLTETVVSEMNDDIDSDRRQFRKQLSSVSKDIPEVINATERVFANPIFMSMTKTPLKETEKNFGVPNQFRENKTSINDAIGIETSESMSSVAYIPNPKDSLDFEEINENSNLLSDNIHSMTNDKEYNTRKDGILKPSIFTSMAECNPNNGDGNQSESERFII